MASDFPTGEQEAARIHPNITSGIPSEIYVAIGRGRYTDDHGTTSEYELAEDVVDAVREECAAEIEYQGKLLNTIFEDGRYDALIRDLARHLRRFADAK